MSTLNVPCEALATPTALTQPVYQPGKPIDDVARELGLDPASIVKLASNENFLGAPESALQAARRALEEVELYPDGAALKLKAKLAVRYGFEPRQFVIGNGSNEILELLGHAFLRPGDETVMGDRAFIVYKLVSLLFGAKPVEVPMRSWAHDLDAMAAAVTERTKLVFVASPNNPTGAANGEAELLEFARSLPETTIFVFDEAYAEYLENPPDLRPLIREGRKVICLRTFSKIYGLAGLRVGYSYSSLEIAKLLNQVRQPFNVGSIGQAAASAALDDEAFVARCRVENAAGLVQLDEGFKALGLESIPSAVNFITVKVGQGGAVFEGLQRRGLIVRPLAPYGMPEWIRITVGSREQNERLLAALPLALAELS
jgi:histidinol-phosphate aminotransferase